MIDTGDTITWGEGESSDVGKKRGKRVRRSGKLERLALGAHTVPSLSYAWG